MKIERTFISPSIAKKMLEKNTNNRHVKLELVRRYKTDMLEGRWMEDTGELIKMGKSGIVLDGQHRLIALVEANKGFYFHVGSQIDDAVMPMLDTGATRTASDVYSMKKILYASELPAIVNFYCSLTNGHIYRDNRNKLTNQESLDFVLSKRVFWENVGTKSSVWYSAFSRILSKTMIGGFYSFFYDISPKDAENFFVELCTGINVTNDTIRVLRKKLNDDKISTKKITMTHKIVFIIKSWNAYRKGVELRVLKYDSNTEVAPVAI